MYMYKNGMVTGHGTRARKASVVDIGQRVKPRRVCNQYMQGLPIQSQQSHNGSDDSLTMSYEVRVQDFTGRQGGRVWALHTKPNT
jgi:hypothetical protein